MTKETKPIEKVEQVHKEAPKPTHDPHFKATIEAYLKKLASADKMFAKRMEREDKNIDDCLNYILKTVQASGCNGFEDSTIFGMAIHYYDEDKVDSGGFIQAKVVMNKTIELTEEEIAQAKQEAKDKVIANEMSRLTDKPKKAVTIIPEKTSETVETAQEQGTLF